MQFTAHMLLESLELRSVVLFPTGLQKKHRWGTTDRKTSQMHGIRTAGTICKMAGIISQMAGIRTRTVGKISRMTGTGIRTVGITSQMAGIRTRMDRTTGIKMHGDSRSRSRIVFLHRRPSVLSKKRVDILVDRMHFS